MTNCRNCGHSVEQYHTTSDSGWARQTAEAREGLKPKNGNIFCYVCTHANKGGRSHHFVGHCSRLRIYKPKEKEVPS